MYVANHFRIPEERVTQMLGEVNVGNLITMHESGMQATMVPFYMEERDGKRFLVTHLVRNNPQAREPIVGNGLVILDIVDEYVSPAWYATNDAMPNVPTWDYITIHARGPVHVDPAPAAALNVAQALTERMGESWSTDMVGQEKLDKMARAIVAVELEIEDLEPKAKMSQNRHPDDIRSLIAHFETVGPHEFVNYLREVSLPYAEQRFDMITDLKSSGASQWDLRPAPPAPDSRD